MSNIIFVSLAQLKPYIVYPKSQHLYIVLLLIIDMFDNFCRISRDDHVIGKIFSYH